jgi:hypothetical protein
MVCVEQGTAAVVQGNTVTNSMVRTDDVQVQLAEFV